MTDLPALVKELSERCPFCGDSREPEPYDEEDPFCKTPLFYRICQCCGAYGPVSNSDEEALKTWNTRAIEAQQSGEGTDYTDSRKVHCLVVPAVEMTALKAKLAEAEKARDEAKKVRVGYDRWLQGGIYHTTDEYRTMVVAPLDTARAENARLREALETIAACRGSDERNEMIFMLGVAQQALAAQPAPETPGTKIDKP